MSKGVVLKKEQTLCIMSVSTPWLTWLLIGWMAGKGWDDSFFWEKDAGFLLTLRSE